MSAHALSRLSPQEYHALDEATPRGIKYELIGGDLYMMAGASPNHVRIAMAVRGWLDQHLPAECEVFDGDLKVQIDPLGTYVYPDASVACNASFTEDGQLTDPVLIAEVLSVSTAIKDQGAKFEAYTLLPSIQEYWLIEQHTPRVVQHARSGDTWITRLHTGMNAVLHSPTFDIDLPLSTVYRRVF